MNSQEPEKEEILNFLKEVTIIRIDEILQTEKTENSANDFLIKTINYFALYLQKFYELPPIDENVLDKIIHSVFHEFIRLVLPTQDVDLFAQSLLNIGSIAYFYLAKRKEASFFPILTDFITNYKSFIPKNHINFARIESFILFYAKKAVLNYVTNNMNLDQKSKEEITKEKNIQFRPNREYYSLNSAFANALYMSGLFLEIRKYISDITFFNDNDQSKSDCFSKATDILTFLKACTSFMSNEYKNYFSYDLKNRLQSLDTNFSLPSSTFSNKFNCKDSLNYCRTLRDMSDLSDDSSNFFNDLFFTTISNLIKSDNEENYNIAILELNSFPQLPYFSQNFIEKLSDKFFNEFITFVKEKDIKVVDSISRLLYLKEMLPESNKLFEICSGKNFLYYSLFPYIQDLFNNEVIDELFLKENELNDENVSLKESTAKLIVELLNHDKYNKNTKLNLIFKCLFNILLNQNLFIDSMIHFSEKNDFKQPIFQALQSIIKIDDIKFDSFFICKILSNLNSTLKFNDNSCDFPFSAISENLIYEIDSILIPQYFNSYKFLPISDVELFWDLSVHSFLFYKLIEPKCSEIKEILLNSSEFSIGLSNCLLSLFEKEKEIKILCRAAIVAYSLNDSLATNEKENSKNDFLLDLIFKIKKSFNKTKKNENFFNDLIEIIENTNEEYKEQLLQFLSEVDMFENVDENNDYLFVENDLSQINNYSDDKIAILIILLMIKKHEKIDEIISTSIIEKLFNSSSIFAKTIISKFISTNENLIDKDLIKFVFIENAQLGNYNICKNLIKLIDISINDEFIYFSTPEIIEMIFTEKIEVQETIFPILPLLQNCQSYEQYEISLICLVECEPSTDQLAPFLLNLILSKEIPSCIRNDKIIQLFMNRISEKPTGFIDYLIKSTSRINFTEYQPLTNYPFLHVLSNFNDFIYDLINYKEINNQQKSLCHELAYLLGNLKFTSLSKIENKSFPISKLDNLYNFIPSSLMAYFKVTFIKGNKIVEDKFITLIGEQSVSYSLSKMMTKDNIIINSSPILIINFDQSISNSQLLIDEFLDISDYSAEQLRLIYKLNSVVTEHNVYIYDANHINNEMKKEPGFICYTNNVTFFIKNILEPIKYIVYVQENKKDELNLWNSFIENNKSIVYDMGCIFMKILNNPNINWNLFKQRYPNFINSSITIIHQLFLRPLFDTFCDDSEFSEHLFKYRFDVLYDNYFTNTFSNEIIRAAKVFPDKGLLMCLLCDDVLNYNEKIFLTLLKSVDFHIDNKIYAIQKMSFIYKEKSFMDYFSEFIKSPELTKEKIHELIQSNEKLLTCIFKISDPSLIDIIDNNDSLELFKKAVISRPSFLSELLQKSKNDDSTLPEKIKLASSKLYDNQQYQNLVLLKMKEKNEDENQKILTLDVLKNLLMSSNKEFRDEIINEMKNQYPPDSIKDFKIPNMIINLLDSTNNYEGLWKLVDIYRESFRSNSKITDMFVLYLFTNRPSTIVDYDKIAELTLKLANPQFMSFIGAMKGNFPLNPSDQYRVMRNYSSGDIEKAYRLFFRIFGKCRFLASFDRYKYDFDILLQSCYSSLTNKNDIIELIEPLFFNYMQSNYATLLLIHMQRYPILLANYIDKIISYKSMRESYAFSTICCTVASMLLCFNDRDIFYTSQDNVDDLITKILNSTNEFIENVVLQLNWNPKIEHTINYVGIIQELDIMLDSLKMLKHDGRLELIRFYRNLAFTIPGFIIKLLNIFLFDGRNYYNFLPEEDERIALSNLICELFRECIGDRQIVPSQNSQTFLLIGSFLKAQFMKCLICKSLNYKIVRPYLVLLRAIIKLPYNNPVKQSTVHMLEKNAYVYNLFTNLTISNKILVLEETENGTVVKNEEFLELKAFFCDLIDFGKYSDNSFSPILNSNQMALAIQKLKKEDELFNYRVLMFDSIIQKLPEPVRKAIVQQTFEFIDELNSESTDENDPIQHLLIVYLENYE